MKFTIFFASGRKKGNTASLLPPFMETLRENGNDVEVVDLFEKKITPCVACISCQNTFDGFGCPFKDDMYEIFDKILASDCIVLATPIYSWYCTAPMKAMIDRMIYGTTKNYGETRGPKLAKGIKMAIISTAGYDPQFAGELFQEGMKRVCKHTKMDYLGMLTVHDPGYKSTFLNDEKIEQAKQFARDLISQM